MISNWVIEALQHINRRTIPIEFSDHARLDKNLSFLDLELAETTVRFGVPLEEKSTTELERICLRKYFKQVNQTYFVIIQIYLDYIQIITVIKKHGN
ncbi:TPA: hypothetical protein HA249_05500 [Candidatus Woesearchaeota archaeon]|nr:hypothetical protein [Candidatus Woesearchaeota archaeon]HIH46842.1 hypothetical protein [Candidatus Woesearchaeota archaeon]